jgi:hypothetical protein
VTLREQIRQARRPWSTCAIAGLLMWAPPGFFAALKNFGLGDTGEYWPLLVILVLVGALLLLVGAIGQWSIRCPKCRGVLGSYAATTGKYCRHCGADFNAEV